MAERIALAGGTLTADRHGDQWVVEAHVPRVGQPMTVRVALVDDQALFRAGIAMLIGSQPDLDVVGEASRRQRGARRWWRTCQPDVVLMDVRMGRVDGVAATRDLVAAYGDRAPKVLVLTTFDHDEAAASAIEAGASGFVLKGAEPEFLLASVRAVAAGNQVGGGRRRPGPSGSASAARPTRTPGP